jgi:hypothetical protein
VLYIWSTYVPEVKGSFRYYLDLALCAVFAVEFVMRTRDSGVSPLSLVDVLSFLPTLLEASPLGDLALFAQLDLRWLRIVRSLRLLRVFLLTSNLPTMKLSAGSIMTGAFNVRQGIGARGLGLGGQERGFQHRARVLGLGLITMCHNCAITATGASDPPPPPSLPPPCHLAG